MSVMHLSDIERRRERSFALSLGADSGILLLFLGLSIWSGSLTLLADTVRGLLLLLLGIYALTVLQRVHRKHLAAYEFGTGKLEQFANFLVGLALLMGGLWVAARAVGNIVAPPPPVPDPGMRLMLAMAGSALNTLVNLAAFWALWRAGRDGTSLIMRGQIRARLGKLVTSLVVTGAIGLSAAAPGSAVARVADIAGPIFVVGVMLYVSATLLREALPDLLDRALDEARQAAINQVLVRHYDRYETLESVRSRQAGTSLYVEIGLGFGASLNFGEVATVCREMAEHLRELIPGADVTVVPVVRPQPGRLAVAHSLGSPA
jgi:cation diffusion facilitator family transporter